MALAGFVVGALLVMALRAWWGWDPVWTTEVILVVGGMVLAPLGFLAGIGSFDYWLHYIAGRPTRAGGSLGTRRAHAGATTSA